MRKGPCARSEGACALGRGACAFGSYYYCPVAHVAFETCDGYTLLPQVA